MRVSVGKLMGWLVGVSLLMATPFAFAGGSNGASSLNTSSTLNNDWSAMRGFTPVAPFGAPHADTSDISAFLAGSTEFGNGVQAGAFGGTLCQQRVDCNFTSNADAFVEGGDAPLSTQPAALDQTGDPGYYFLSYVEDGDDGAGNPTFTQGFRNDSLSRAIGAGTDCGLVSATAGQVRCNEIEYGFSQVLDLTGGITTTNGTAGGGAGTGGTQVFDLLFTVDALVDANGDLLGQAQGTFSQAGSAGTCTGTFTYDSTTGVNVTGTLGTYTLDSGRASGDC
jgi:hypothetical protein